jgi:hypothetical protein
MSFANCFKIERPPDYKFVFVMRLFRELRLVWGGCLTFELLIWL